MGYQQLYDPASYSLRTLFAVINNHVLLQALTFLLVALLLRILWRFNILPYLHPDSPKEPPYWIPFIGHGFSFFQSADILMSKASRYFGNKEPYSLTVFGNTLYIVTEPHDTTEVYKSDDTLSLEMFVQDLFRSNGYSEHALGVTYAKLPKDKPGFDNPQGVSFRSFAKQMHTHQLYPGKNLQVLEGNFRNWFDQSLSLPELKRTCSRFSLAYFGDVLSRINPNLADDFLAFDDLGWQVFELSGNSSRSRNAREGAAWLINAMEDEARALGVGNEDIAVFDRVTVVGGKLLREGHRIMIHYRQLAALRPERLRCRQLPLPPEPVRWREDSAYGMLRGEARDAHFRNHAAEEV
ncbi:uncharacterized protein F4812DRAFT_463116 [Daldinia caldariorum]|uniref:uncharacterized protein n=1 Tax=Daldinia caldariorum TaxID=326644 RepID=UPI002008C228|nr:uncharacterized protein F4812DRAFT_463116 [Daldinia caldariorum]KAI1464055.1 hypothetical protein F4812DRAFT_463116 [Daldinia caldariorum]